MPALDLISATVTAPGASGTAMSAVAGDALAVRNCNQAAQVGMIACWTKAQGVGYTQIVWPSGHDTTRNWRYRNVANQPGNMMPRGIVAPFRPQDPLTLTEVGSATAGDIETAHMLVYYEDLPGIAANLIDVAALGSRFVRLTTVEDSSTATAGGAYSGQRALNAGSSLLHANTDYAILGAKIGAACGALCIRGADTGNLRVAIPGLTSPDIETVNWFVQLSEWLGKPCIPVVNSANAAGIFIDQVQDENLTAVPFSLILAELSS